MIEVNEPRFLFDFECWRIWKAFLEWYLAYAVFLAICISFNKVEKLRDVNWISRLVPSAIVRKLLAKLYIWLK